MLEGIANVSGGGGYPPGGGGPPGGWGPPGGPPPGGGGYGPPGGGPPPGGSSRRWLGSASRCASRAVRPRLWSSWWSASRRSRWSAWLRSSWCSTRWSATRLRSSRRSSRWRPTARLRASRCPPRWSAARWSRWLWPTRRRSGWWLRPSRRAASARRRLRWRSAWLRPSRRRASGRRTSRLGGPPPGGLRASDSRSTERAAAARSARRRRQCVVADGGDRLWLERAHEELRRRELADRRSRCSSLGLPGVGDRRQSTGCWLPSSPSTSMRRCSAFSTALVQGTSSLGRVLVGRQLHGRRHRRASRSRSRVANSVSFGDVFSGGQILRPDVRGSLDLRVHRRRAR